MPFDIKGKVALVTGGASGIGFQTTLDLLRNGVKGLTIVDMNEIVSEKAMAEIKELFGPDKAIFIKADVSNIEDLRNAFENTVQVFGNLDIVINSAGICDESKWQKEITVNLNGVFNSMDLGVNKYLREYRQGPEAVIVNVASMAIFRNHHEIPVYVATKYGVLGLTKCWGNDEVYNKNKIKIVAVCPGVTETPILQNLEKEFLKFSSPSDSYVSSCPIQEPSFVSKEILDIVKFASNGSIWVVDNNEPAYQYIHPLVESMRSNVLPRS